ncbi:flagellar FlbD family protein [Alicyclobacillus fructus]|uniref:flagellar FlbD family protein n=1 Tax=Alicyclobacillus fructus TaxID=2816082 RepID=UPI001A8E0F9E|nr:flagellar FlbD family protein [Alicyclobacillus fructus]
MIALTRLNGTVVWLNPLHIETIEVTPDSVVTLTNGHKYVVLEDPETIASKMIEVYRRIGLVTAPVRDKEGGA